MSLNQKLYCNSLGCRMAYAVKGITRMLKKRFSQEGIELTLEQYFILNILDNEEGLILQELADIVDRDKSAVARHIDSLEENHFVLRAPDPEDKRRKMLHVTKPGMAELQKAMALDKQINDEITSHFDSQKVEAVEAMLSRIYEKSLEIECS